MSNVRRFGFVFILVALLVTACTTEDKAEKVGTATTEAGGSEGGQTAATGKGGGTFKVGDQVKIGDYQVVVYKVTDPLAPTNQFLKPASGKRWVALDMEVSNTTAKPASFSILACCELQDSKNQTYSMSLGAGADPKPPDGEIGPNSSKRGQAVFEVPEDATGLKLLFKSGFFRTGQAVIQLS